MSDKTGSHLALEDRILWALEPDEAGPLHMAKLRAESSQQAKAICGERKHPGPWKVFGGENTEAILDGNGDIVVQARPLEGGRAVLDFGSDEARRMVLAASNLYTSLNDVLVHFVGTPEVQKTIEEAIDLLDSVDECTCGSKVGG